MAKQVICRMSSESSENRGMAVSPAGPSNTQVVKSAVWYTASNLLVKALGFVTVPIFTRLLTKTEFGIYNNYLSWLAVMTVVVSLSLEATIISAKRDYPDDLDSYVFSMMVLSIVSALIWLVLASMFATQFEDALVLDRRYINALFLYLLFFPVVTLFQTWERFTYRYKVTVAVSVILAVGIAALSVVLTLVLPNKLDGAIGGRTLPAIFVGLVLLIWFWRRGTKLHVPYWKYALPIAAPFIPHLLSMTLLGALNRIMVTRMCGAEANAMYGLAHSCGQIITIFVTSLNGAFSPWLGDKLTQKGYGEIKSVARPYVACFAVIAALVSLLAPEVLLILGDTAYLDAVYVIPPVAVGCVLQFIYTMYVNVEQYEKKTAGMAIASASAVGVNYVLDRILIPQFGYVAAGWASAISYGWLMAAHMWLVHRMGMLHVYDNRFNVLMAAGIAAAIGLCALVYPYTALRWAIFAVLVVVFAAFAWTHRTVLMGLVRRGKTEA